MPSPINDAFRASQAALMSVFGEGVEIVPMKTGDYSTGPDPDRARITTTAKLSTAIKSVELKGQQTGRGSEFQGATRAMTDSPELWIDADTVRGLAWKPKHGDIVIATARDGSPRFTVLASYPGDLGDLHIVLTRGAAALPAQEPDPAP
jgi:hypothetical protein